MMSAPLVSIVDDDESVRESLPDLLKEFGFAVTAFSSAHAFLTSGNLADTRCLILDIAMPGMSGPELQQELAARRYAIPIVFITATVDEATPLRMLELGAAACLFKPFSNSALLGAVRDAIEHS